MARLRERISVKAVWDLELQLIEDGDRLWLRLSLPNDARRQLAMWSTKPEAEYPRIG